MAGGRQKRATLQAKREKRRKKAAVRDLSGARKPARPGSAPVNEAAMAPYNSYGTPAFAQRGYYVDVEFRCENCGRDQLWTATQQKWWYEVAKGYAYSTAKLCRACRALVRAQKEESRLRQKEGAARKRAKA